MKRHAGATGGSRGGGGVGPSLPSRNGGKPQQQQSRSASSVGGAVPSPSSSSPLDALSQRLLEGVTKAVAKHHHHMATQEKEGAPPSTKVTPTMSGADILAADVLAVVLDVLQQSGGDGALTSVAGWAACGGRGALASAVVPAPPAITISAPASSSAVAVVASNGNADGASSLPQSSQSSSSSSQPPLVEVASALGAQIALVRQSHVDALRMVGGIRDRLAGAEEVLLALERDGGVAPPNPHQPHHQPTAQSIAAAASAADDSAKSPRALSVATSVASPRSDNGGRSSPLSPPPTAAAAAPPVDVMARQLLLAKTPNSGVPYEKGSRGGVGGGVMQHAQPAHQTAAGGGANNTCTAAAMAATVGLRFPVSMAAVSLPSPSDASLPTATASAAAAMEAMSSAIDHLLNLFCAERLAGAVNTLGNNADDGGPPTTSTTSGGREHSRMDRHQIIHALLNSPAAGLPTMGHGNGPQHHPHPAGGARAALNRLSPLFGGAKPSVVIASSSPSPQRRGAAATAGGGSGSSGQPTWDGFATALSKYNANAAVLLPHGGVIQHPHVHHRSPLLQAAQLPSVHVLNTTYAFKALQPPIVGTNAANGGAARKKKGGAPSSSLTRARVSPYAVPPRDDSSMTANPFYHNYEEELATGTGPLVKEYSGGGCGGGGTLLPPLGACTSGGNSGGVHVSPSSDMRLRDQLQLQRILAGEAPSLVVGNGGGGHGHDAATTGAGAGDASSSEHQHAVAVMMNPLEAFATTKGFAHNATLMGPPPSSPNGNAQHNQQQQAQHSSPYAHVKGKALRELDSPRAQPVFKSVDVVDEYQREREREEYLTGGVRTMEEGQWVVSGKKKRKGGEDSADDGRFDAKLSSGGGLSYAAFSGATATAASTTGGEGGGTAPPPPRKVDPFAQMNVTAIAVLQQRRRLSTEKVSEVIHAVKKEVKQYHHAIELMRPERVKERMKAQVEGLRPAEKHCAASLATVKTTFIEEDDGGDGTDEEGEEEDDY